MTTALVVDDDKDAVTVLSEFLELNGIVVIGRGRDGKQAVEQFKKLGPDIVFLDVMMDQYDGIYALEKIKNIQQDAVVIMITADLTSDTAYRLAELKPSATIYKPYTFGQILSLVSKLVLDKKGLTNAHTN